MSLTDYVIMPGEDYQEICDAVREQTETTDPIKSGEAAPMIRSIQRGGGVTSWNDLEDKPFGDLPTGGNTITWDGNTEGLESVEVEGMPFYKVSDAYVSFEDIQNGFKYSLSTGISDARNADDVQALIDDGMLVVYDNAVLMAQLFASVLPGSPEAQMLGVSGGTYLFCYPGWMHTTSLTISGAAPFPSVQTIDPKYVPTGHDIVFKCADNELSAASVITLESGDFTSCGEILLQKGVVKALVKCELSSYESVWCANNSGLTGHFEFIVIGGSGDIFKCYRVRVSKQNAVSIRAVTTS